MTRSASESASTSLSLAAERGALDAEAVRAQVEQVLAEDLYWFPVRHHSPAAARHLEEALRARRPRVIFIELPADVGPLLEFVVDKETRPPIALYSSYRDDDNVLGLAGIASPSEKIPPRWACWLPLVEFSPEYVALRVAKEIRAEVVPFDLPHYAQIEPRPAEPPATDAPLGTQAPESPAASGPSDDLVLCDSGFYRALAEAAGYRSFDEAWDAIFEFGPLTSDREAFRRELATFCAAARATTPAARIAADDTLPRERHMLQTIRRTLAERGLAEREAVVVCGGFHLFLDRADAAPPPVPPAGTVYNSVVPYSFFRISELSGYAAGNRAPQFYQMTWDARREAGRDDFVADYIVTVLQRLRRRGAVASSADAIATAQHARMLAALRGRAVPILDDLHDALVTCCVKGDPQEEGRDLLRAIDDVDVGTKVGRVTQRLGRLPLVTDFYNTVSDLDLGAALAREKQATLDLDKRQPRDAARSVFLHRLAFLEAPFGQLIDVAAGDFATGLIFRERWRLRWDPKLDAALIEKSLYGDTVVAATLARLREELAVGGQGADVVCRRLVQAIEMDLPDLVREVQAAASRAIDEDGRFVALTKALGSLTVIDRYAEHRELRRDVLADLIVRCFDRACFAIVGVVAIPEDQQPDVVQALFQLSELVLQAKSSGLDRTLFIEHVRHAAEQTDVPFLRGAFLGILAELRVIPAEELAGEVAALAKASQAEMVKAGDLLDGVLAVSRASILLGANSLVAAVDELLRAAEWESFLVMLPRMRSAFERLHRRQRDRVAETVAERYGLKEVAEVRELRTSARAAVRIAELDRRVAELMQKWE